MRETSSSDVRIFFADTRFERMARRPGGVPREKADEVFDILKPTVAEGGLTDEAIDALAAERVAAKKSRDFARADAIRAELLEKGIILEDTKEGTRWKRKA